MTREMSTYDDVREEIGTPAGNAYQWLHETGYGDPAWHLYTSDMDKARRNVWKEFGAVYAALMTGGTQ